MKRWMMLALGPLVSIGLMYVLVGRDIGAVQGELSRAHFIYLIPCGLLLVISLFTRAVRWHILLDRKVSIWHSFHILNVGYFLSGVLPLRLGDVARAWMATRLETPIAAFSAISTIVLEKILDLLMLVAMLGFMLVLLDVPAEVTSAGVVIGMGAMLAGLVLVMISTKPNWIFRLLDSILEKLPFLKNLDLHTRLHHFIDGIQPIGQPRVAVGALVWTAISWGFSLVAGYILLFMLFDEPTIVATVSYIALASMSVGLPAVPGNLGPFEGAVVGGLWIGNLIPTVSAPENAPAVAFAVALHALTLGIYVTLGLIGLLAEHASVGQITHETKMFIHEQTPRLSESA